MASDRESIDRLMRMRDNETTQMLGIAVLRRPTYWAMAIGDPVEIVRAETAEDAFTYLQREWASWSKS